MLGAGDGGGAVADEVVIVGQPERREDRLPAMSYGLRNTALPVEDAQDPALTH
jgi:hypothetical protein